MDPLAWPGMVADWWAANAWAGKAAGIIVLWTATLLFVRYNARLFRELDNRIAAFDMSERTLYHLDRLLDTATFILAGLLSLGILGVTGALYGALTALGIIGLVIGFASQDLVKNLFAGLSILLERPFMPGDSIEVAGQGGEVVRVNLRSTVMKTWDGRQVILPNATFISNSIVNYSANPIRRVDAPVSILHESDADRAMAVMREVAESDPERVAESGIDVRVNEVRDYALVLELRFWVPRASLFAARTRTLVALTKAFAREGIELAVPIRRTVMAASPAAGGVVTIPDTD